MSNKRVPWLTRDFIVKKQQKAYLKQKATISKSEADWSVYKSAKKSYNRLIKDTVRQYYQDKLQSNSGNLKKTWKTINELMNKFKKGSKIHELRTDNNETIDPLTFQMRSIIILPNWETNNLMKNLHQS